MRKLRLSFMLCAGILLVPSGYGQQVKGDQELGLNGAFTVPHSSPSDANGEATVSYGYYFRRTDLIGADTVIFVQKDQQLVFLQARYRHLFGTKNAKAYPFVGAQGGGILTRSSGSTSGNGVGVAEAGLKLFVSQRTALELAYNFDYIQQSGGSFADNSESVISVGFTHIFGGHPR